MKGRKVVFREQTREAKSSPGAKKQVLSTVVTQAMRRDVESAAFQDGMSVSEWIREVIQARLDREE